MPVDSRHADYEKRIRQVRKIRTFVEGEDGARDYVQRLPGQQNAKTGTTTTEQDREYKMYRDRAYYLPATSRTLQAFVGMVMSPEPNIANAPKGLEAIIEDVDNKGEPMRRMMGRVVSEVLTSGKCAVLAEGPDSQSGSKIKLVREKAGERAYAAIYKFDSILDWKVTKVGGRMQLSQIRLLEDYDHEVDEFTTKTYTQIRVLDLINGAYRQRVYRRKNPEAVKDQRNVGESGMGTGLEQKWEQFGKDVFPILNGTTLDHIPLVVFNPDSLDPGSTSQSPLSDLVELNCAHLQNSAGLEWTLLWCGCPTPVLSGTPPLDEDNKPAPLRIGSSQGLVIPDGATFEIVAMDPAGVGALREAMREKKEEMVAIGARAMMPGEGSNISTDTEKIRRVGEHSVLAQVANTCSDGFTKVLKLLAAWAKVEVPEDMQVTLNTDFLPSGLQSGELTEWLSGVQNGTIPVSVFVDHMKNRGVLDPDMTTEDYRAALDEDDFGVDPGAGSDEPEDDDEEDNEQEAA